MKIGSFLLKNRSSQLNAKLNVSSFKILSFWWSYFVETNKNVL